MAKSRVNLQHSALKLLGSKCRTLFKEAIEANEGQFPPSTSDASVASFKPKNRLTRTNDQLMS